MFLENEIREQGAIVANLLHRQSERIARLAEAIRAYEPVFVCLAARGTSDNAALYAKYLFGSFLRMPMMLATPSLHTLYHMPPNLARSLVIGISQSGRAEDVRQVLQDAREQGAFTVAITNYDDSPMAQTAEHHIAILAGEEQSIAATKTYTAQMTVLAMLAAALDKQYGLQAELQALPDYVNESLAEAEKVREWSQRYRYMSNFSVIGRGYNLCTALEVSLKVKELCYLSTTGYSEADFRHGPIAMIQPGFPVMLIAPQGRTLEQLRDLAVKLREREAELLIVSNDDDLLAQGMYAMRQPAMPEWLSPIPCVIPGQMFAMLQAMHRGYAVDRPRGLSKVTVTL
jgi:glucosamine--fructose-6-phosphate aminotransferase (isomerizing)